MKVSIRIIFALGFSVSLFSFLNAQDAKRILFIGNSYTYFWNLPQTVQAMCLETGDQVEIRQSTIGGANLGQHWRSERNLQSRQFLERSSWDMVVLQDFSMSAVDTPDSLQHYGEKWIDLIKERGAEPALYMTWAREFNPLMLDQVSRGYEQLGSNAGAEVVQVGNAWSLARSLRPDLNLFAADGSHPSPLGTYLTACMFYQWITGKSARGLPNRLIAEDSEGEKLYLSIVSGGDAVFCQEVAHRIGMGE